MNDAVRDSGIFRTRRPFGRSLKFLARLVPIDELSVTNDADLFSSCGMIYWEKVISQVDSHRRLR